MSYEKRNTLYIFLDETGDFNFGPQGSRYFMLSAMCTFLPEKGSAELVDLLYTIADEGRGQECFHATEDKQPIRDLVFKRIGDLKDNFKIYSMIAEKSKANPSLYKHTYVKNGKSITKNDPFPFEFYQRVCRALLRYIFRLPKYYKKAERVVVIVSHLFTKAKNEAIDGALRQDLVDFAQIPYQIYFHQNKSDHNCQITDYCAWAIGTKWERNENRSYELIRTRIDLEFDMFRYGTMEYYIHPRAPQRRV